MLGCKLCITFKWLIWTVWCDTLVQMSSSNWTNTKLFMVLARDFLTQLEQSGLSKPDRYIIEQKSFNNWIKTKLFMDLARDFLTAGIKWLIWIIWCYILVQNSPNNWTNTKLSMVLARGFLTLLEQICTTLRQLIHVEFKIKKKKRRCTQTCSCPCFSINSCCFLRFSSMVLPIIAPMVMTQCGWLALKAKTQG